MPVPLPVAADIKAPEVLADEKRRRKPRAVKSQVPRAH
jgi:hypothetical protein